VTSVEETLAWEAEQRPRAVAVALVGAVLTLAGNVMLAVITRGGPTEADGFISLTESLGAGIAGRRPSDQSLLVRQVDFYGDHAGLLSLATVLTTLAAICAGLLLLFLYRAAAARSEAVGRLPLYATLSGLLLYPLGHAVRELAAWIGSVRFADEPVRTAETARDIFASNAVSVGSLFEVLGSFSLALAFVLVCLNAMRVGVLTRFLGILGIIVGVLAVFQLDQPQIVRAFWLAAVGLLIAGRTRTGLPPAWETGRAEPWPSQQQIREQRQAAAAGAAPPPEPAEPVGSGEPAAPERRKRKRRR
jgi:hypothetical protein